MEKVVFTSNSCTCVLFMFCLMACENLGKTKSCHSFGEENPELLAKFLKLTADMNAKYAADSDSMINDIQKSAGMDLDATKAVIKTFVFPTVAEQLSDEWMGGGVAEYLASSAASLEADGKIKALSDYNAVVNSSYLEAASKM